MISHIKSPIIFTFSVVFQLLSSDDNELINRKNALLGKGMQRQIKMDSVLAKELSGESHNRPHQGAKNSGALSSVAMPLA